MVTDTRFRTYLKAFGADWLSRMCGPLTVPFGAIAIWWAHAPSAKVLWACLAVVAFLLASYRVWRNERNKAAREAEDVRGEYEAKLTLLHEEIRELRRKPYAEELEKRAASLIAKLSGEGRTLLRHVLINEPIEIGRRFRPEIAQDVQDAQIAIAYESGIVRHNIERAGSGMIVGQYYVVNPEYRSVLKDLLYKA